MFKSALKAAASTAIHAELISMWTVAACQSETNALRVSYSKVTALPKLPTQVLYRTTMFLFISESKARFKFKDTQRKSGDTKPLNAKKKALQKRLNRGNEKPHTSTVIMNSKNMTPGKISVIRCCNQESKSNVHPGMKKQQSMGYRKPYSKLCCRQFQKINLQNRNRSYPMPRLTSLSTLHFLDLFNVKWRCSSQSWCDDQWKS